MELFPISKITGQPFIEENCQTSRTCNDIDVKLGPVTKIEKKKNTALSKKSDDGVMSEFVTPLSFSVLSPTGSNSEV